MDRRILIAEDGMWITDGVGCYKRVALGNWDSVDNYMMVTDAEYNARMTTETEDV